LLLLLEESVVGDVSAVVSAVGVVGELAADVDVDVGTLVVVFGPLVVVGVVQAVVEVGVGGV